MRVRPSGFIAGAGAALILAVASSVAAQQSTINGRVIDLESNQPINGAEVAIGGVSVLTNNQGAFTLSVAPGRHSVTISSLGYETSVRAVNVAAGATASLQVVLITQALAVQGVTVTVVPNQPLRTGEVPQVVHIVQRREIEGRATTTPVDHLAGLAGVDLVSNGVNQRTVVARGFNNVFSGALLVLTDNRYARVPSVRFNAYNMIPSTSLDIESIEIILGPSSALYGPNSANGVMHITTTSAIDRPGTSVSLSGGSRNIFDGAFRQAFRFSEKAGLKISGQYFQGEDFAFVDSAENLTSDPSNPLIGARDFDSEKWGGEARFDLRPWEGSNDGVTLTYGLNRLVNSVEMTGIGAGQAKDWKYEFGQVQFRKAGFYWQAFLNRSNAGDTYLLRTGSPLIDESKVFVTQGQYALGLSERLDLVTGGRPGQDHAPDRWHDQRGERRHRRDS